MHSPAAVLVIPMFAGETFVHYVEARTIYRGDPIKFVSLMSALIIGGETLLRSTRKRGKMSEQVDRTGRNKGEENHV